MVFPEGWNNEDDLSPDAVEELLRRQEEAREHVRQDPDRVYDATYEINPEDIEELDEHLDYIEDSNNWDLGDDDD